MDITSYLLGKKAGGGGSGGGGVKLQQKDIFESGDHYPDDGYDGFSMVYVEVAPSIPSDEYHTGAFWYQYMIAGSFGAGDGGEDVYWYDEDKLIGTWDDDREIMHYTDGMDLEYPRGFQNLTRLEYDFLQCYINSEVDGNNYQVRVPIRNMVGTFDLTYLEMLRAVFEDCTALQSVGQIKTGRYLRQMVATFRNCQSLEEIPEMDMRGVTQFLDIVRDCFKLKSIGFKNIKANLQVGSGSEWGHLLTVDSLVHLIYELRDTGSSKALTVGSANLEKLANIYVKLIDITDEMRAEDDLIDEKLPFVVCESTDEGAIPSKDYVIEKNWTLK